MSDNQRRQSDPAQPRVNTADLLGVTPAGVDDVFLGEPRDYGPLRIYGGHFLAQALAAAFGTVAENKLAHSLHAYFLRTGIPDWPIQYRVDRLREGGGYETRAVRATQQGNTVFFMSASFKVPEVGDAHQPSLPAMGGPAAAMARRVASGRERVPLPFTLGTGVELEILDDWSPLNARRDEGGIQLWMRLAAHALPSPQLQLAAHALPSPRLQQCALAFLSDSTLVFNALRRHAQPFVTHRTTSLDHSLWFHRLPDCGQWLFFDQSGPAAADGRGLNHGFIYASDGSLLASVAQEGMMRRMA